ncbi:hypothetical protein B0F90DRAFT_1820382 [Multifurca ochricompacta]|uniref:Coenzyme Q-binding protein COQ10 START domain-containing protein n=1 Tax=Multifurca ochricompacta TaxID=376703 RepID=A0AAD4LZJ3_9AGAM|nr:hypothetical protein B0F90DRAFT_1820382 [Multifurca ochricompacta]
MFTIRSSSLIKAPKQKVWDTLIDFESYNEWNPYIRKQEIINEHDKSPSATQIPAPGRRIRIHTNLPPTMVDDENKKPFTTGEILTHVDDEAFRLAWRFATPAHWLINAERWQVLRDDESRPGGQTTVYETWETFGGLLALLIWLFMGTKLQVAFDAMGSSLKDRAERVA